LLAPPKLALAETAEELIRSSMKTARQQIESLLHEPPAAARVRQQCAFDEAAAGRRRIVIFGAGRLGRSVLQGLSGTDLEPIAFADNNPRAWGTMADGLPVLSPRDAADKHSQDAVFVVAIWHPSRSQLMSALLDQLRTLGCSAVAFPLLFWRHPSIFLPYFFWDMPENLLQQGNDIAAAFELLHDDSSRQSFAAQLHLRLRADFDCIGTPFAGDQYFPGLFSLNPDERFVDCGSYTGDTIQSFISQTDNCFRKVIAFEADPAVMPGLQTFVNSIGTRAVLHNAAVGAHNGVVRFAGDGIGGGCITAASGIEVPCVRLDDALAREHVSFIKMDIEGAELQALEGAHHVIWRDRPVLAVCGYHKPDHLWRVLVSLKSLAPDSALFLRSHCADGLDAVCYAVPPERQIQVAASTTRKAVPRRKSRAHAQGSFS
jgi:FkbM family methyltransferase